MELLEYDKMEAREYARLYNLKDYVIISIMRETGVGAYGAAEIAIQMEENKFRTVNGMPYTSLTEALAGCHVNHSQLKRFKESYNIEDSFEALSLFVYLRSLSKTGKIKY